MSRLNFTTFLLALPFVAGCDSSSSIDTNAVPTTFQAAYQQEIDIKRELTAILNGIETVSDAESANPKITRLAEGLKHTLEGLQQVIDQGKETESQMKDVAKSLSGPGNNATAKMNDAWSRLRKTTELTDALEPSMKEFRSASSSLDRLRRSVTN